MSKQSRPYRLLTFLENLSKEEFREFGKYLRRQAGNKTNNKIRLHNHLSKHWYEADEAAKNKLNNEDLQKQIFKKKLSNNDKINTLNSEFVRTIKHFLMEEMLKKDRTTHNLLWNKILKERGLDGLFFSHNEHSTQKNKQAQTILEAPHHDALYILQNDVTFHRNTPKFKIQHEERLKQTEYHLDMAYMLRKLEIRCEQITRKYLINSNENKAVLILDLEQDIIKNNENNLVQIYLNIIELYDKKTFDIYQKIKKTITDVQLNISNTIRMSFVRLMINHSHRMYLEGNESYFHEVYDLYNFAHQNHLLIEDGYMSERDYLNFVKVTAAVEESWNEKALLDMSNSLKPEYRKNGKLLAEAVLRFKQKKYDKVQLLLLREIQWNSLQYKIDSYCLLIRTLYEAADYERLKEELHTFDLLIDKDKILSEERKLPNRNFANFVRYIAQYKAASTPISEALASDLLRKPTAYGVWCAEKLAEFTKLSV